MTQNALNILKGFGNKARVAKIIMVEQSANIVASSINLKTAGVYQKMQASAQPTTKVKFKRLEQQL
jgi:hypothetical protein